MNEQYIKKLEDENKILNKRIIELESLLNKNQPKIKEEADITDILVDNNAKKTPTDLLKKYQKTQDYKNYFDRIHRQMKDKFNVQ
jgi:hypothetical protein